LPQAGWPILRFLNWQLAYYNAGVVAVVSKGWAPGGNPTIAGYSASAVKIYNVTGSLVRLENKNSFLKRSCPLQHWRWGCKFRSRKIGSSRQYYNEIYNCNYSVVVSRLERFQSMKKKF
jgi:hypothetical protein